MRANSLWFGTLVALAGCNGPNNPFAIFALPVELGELAASSGSDDTSGMVHVSGRGPRSIADAKGQVLVVELWTLDCHECDARMAAYEKLWNEVGDVRVLAIDVDQVFDGTKDKVEARADELDVSYPVMFDQAGKLRSKLKAADLPVCLVFDRDGHLVLSKLGCKPEDTAEVTSTARRLAAK
ncbi:MAG TPA: TlpA disulfide reductase family protein [Polyangiaceae bacterium]|nr:TlpA disulfide reductase family protein [Polyangiaceae bacterium]